MVGQTFLLWKRDSYEIAKGCNGTGKLFCIRPRLANRNIRVYNKYH